jgi:glucuronoarabinoxylan endo-1,4-beta-xylanase
VSSNIIRKPAVQLFTVLLLVVVAFGSFVAMRVFTTHAASSMTIDGATKYQTIDGFGTSEAFGQAQSIENLSSGPQKQLLDLLFNPSTGAGFTILRNLLPSDSGSSIEPNSPGSPTANPTYVPLGSSGGQVWLSQQAKNYGVTQIYGDAWSAPGYMKTNGSESNGGAICGTPGAICSSGDWRLAYANYLTQYAKDYASAGVPLTAIGAFNEPDYTPSYSSMGMTPTQTADFISMLKPTLTAAGLNPQVVCCDPTGWGQAQNYTSAIASNPTANANVDIFSSHGYSGAPDSPLNGTSSKHVWETEWGIFDSIDNNWDDGATSDGFNWAQRIHTGLTAANLSAFFWWWGVIFNASDNGYLINYSGNNVIVSSRLWAFANYSRFIRPGAVRIGASSGDSNLQVSAYKNTNGTVSIVVLNTANNAITASSSLQNMGLADGTTVTPYLTNGSNNTAQQTPTSVSGGSFSATIPARSLVTYVLSGTGAVAPTPIPTVAPTPTPTVTSMPTPTGTPVINSGYAVNAGGAAAGSFTADGYYIGGNTNATTARIRTSGVSNAAPQAVYQTERYGNFTYAIPGLVSGRTYTVRLHFAEIYWTSSGQRTFNVSINGQQVLTNFDIYSIAGGVDKAIVKPFSATANSSGQITIQFTSVVNYAKISGIEILA